MNHTRRMTLLMLASAIAFGGTGAFAQSDEPAQDLITQDLITRWQAAPDTVFDAAEVDLDALLYIARPLIIFADSPLDPLFTEQMELIEARFSELVARDVIVITDTAPNPPSALRAQLRPRGFGLMLFGKDGRLAQRKPTPWDVRELTRAIDKMPLRQQEIEGI